MYLVVYGFDEKGSLTISDQKLGFQALTIVYQGGFKLYPKIDRNLGDQVIKPNGFVWISKIL